MKITPNSETPIEPPICWKNALELLATPMSFCGTLFCAISEVICIRKPMPTPNSTKISAEVSLVVCGPRWVSRNMATVMIAAPMIGRILYRPVLLVT